MEDREFFDHLYKLWSLTSFYNNRFWDYQDNSFGMFEIGAVSEDGDREEIGWCEDESDADFITAVHGCFPDLVRRLHDALDEADRADYERDSRECRIGELESEVADLKKIIEGLSKEPPWNG